MKYTRSELNEVIEVKGCTSCPHMVSEPDNGLDHSGFTVMFCTKPVPKPDGKIHRQKKKLTSNWTGAYHASCPLASSAENVPPNVTPQEKPF